MSSASVNMQGINEPLAAEGTRIGRYETRRQLGRGAFGVVFEARDVELDRDVALKLLMPQHTLDAQVMRRFFHEAKAAARIAHPSIVTIYEFGQVTGTGTRFDGSAFIAMELVRGESLASRLVRTGTLPAATVIELGRQIASAVGAAHRAGIIHRDLKPDNLMLAVDPVAPSGERIKVLDFGIAKLGEAARRSTLQTVGAFGTPLYMSPEQFRAAGEVDARADVYALGCILFELAVGAPPFDGADVIGLFEQHSRARRVAPPGLPAEIGRLVCEMMAADPDDRPGDMAIVEARLAGRHAAAVAVTAVALALHESAASSHPGIATTLGSAASVAVGASITGRRSAHRAWLALGGAGAAALVAAWLGLHHGGTDPEATVEARPALAPARPVSTQPAPAPPPAQPAIATPAPTPALTPVPAPVAVPPSKPAPPMQLARPPTPTPTPTPALTPTPPPTPVPSPSPAPTAVVAPPAVTPPSSDPWGHLLHDTPGSP